MRANRTKVRRLLYITQWFPPEPVAIPIWVAQALDRQGWQVEVLTGQPNYPVGKVQDGYRAGKFARDTTEGFSVTRTPLFASHDSSAIYRMLNYLSWGFTSGLVSPWLSRGRGVSLVYSSPATAAIPAMVARVTVRRPFVLLVQDIWPDSVTSSGFINSGFLSKFVSVILTRFVDLSYRMASQIIVISPGAKALLERRGVSAAKVQVVHNWADEQVMRPIPASGELKRSLGLTDSSFVLMYAGSMGPAQALHHAIDAVDKTSAHIHLVLVGGGVCREALEEQASKVGGGRVHFLPSVPLSEVSKLMADADAQLISLDSDPLFEVTMPSKVQSVLASGCVCIAAAPGDAARTIAAAGGRATPPGDSTALALAIDEIAHLDPEDRIAMRTQALRYYHQYLSEDAGSEALSQILHNVLDVDGKRSCS
ncbi:glycosyltransferase family 4 protein [Janibacter melonis]|uniref:glycosyltransferase family 4 protein n=1 Tax=Janibacter melonis TaxID=262209 RepID=UPI00174DAC7A|nr:glycosyltransferase family 4 protein [Janibacter melonis]